MPTHYVTVPEIVRDFLMDRTDFINDPPPPPVSAEPDPVPVSVSPRRPSPPPVDTSLVVPVEPLPEEPEEPPLPKKPSKSRKSPVVRQPSEPPLIFPSSMPGMEELLKQQPKSLYILTCVVGEKVVTKIGVGEDPQARFENLRSANAFGLKKHKFYMAREFGFWENTAMRIESMVKRTYSNRHSHPHSAEWFRVDPSEIEKTVDLYVAEDKRYREEKEKKNDEFEKTLDPFHTIEGYRN